MASRNPELEFEFVVYGLSRVLSRIHNERFCEIDVNGTRVSALIILRRSEHGMIQSEIAEILSMGKAPAGKMIDQLEKDGLVVRLPSPSDRRVRIVEITKEGRKVVEAAELATADIREAMRRGISKEERIAVIEVLEKMRLNLVEMDESGAQGPVPDLKKRHKRIGSPNIPVA